MPSWASKPILLLLYWRRHTILGATSMHKHSDLRDIHIESKGSNNLFGAGWGCELVFVMSSPGMSLNVSLVSVINTEGGWSDL